MELTAQTLDLKLATPFRISRGVRHTAGNVLVRLEADGLVGMGEAAPSAFYGESRESVMAALSHFSQHLGEDPALIEDILSACERAMGDNAAARAALDMALFDLLGQRLGVPVVTLLGLNPARTPRTSFTIALDTPAEMAARARAAARDYPILKIKLGTDHDLEIVRAIRDVTDVTLRVDANAAWTPKQAIRIIAALGPYNIELVEQPVAKSDLEGLRLVRDNVPLPIFADESCVTLDDIARVAGKVDGINIKLMKCGGLAHALKMIAAARAHHLQVMLGCMIESSLAITAAAHLSPLVEYADLDGALLIASDPFDGVHIERGKLVLPSRPGLGVCPRESARRRANRHEAARVTARVTPSEASASSASPRDAQPA
ncbi:MAG: dipeptide epimerase [Ktedonobacterales bacterium]|nr:dipeptide epimerase [Ktedonobacterales bacterium]